MNVVALNIYPIKSGPAVAVGSVLATARGFEHDRRYMVTTASGQFMTQRTHPALGRPEIELTGGALRLRTADLGELEVGAPTDTELVSVQVWSDRVEARRTTREADEFFSSLVGEPAMLVYMDDHASFRATDDHPDVPLSFADGYPYLLTTTASLDDLNGRIRTEPVSMAAFRPNIVIDGAQPWAEDEWTTLTIGDVALACTTNCERCAITTLEPSFPDRPRRDGEPLRTLAKFRRNPRGKVDFGRNALATTSGVISVAEAVTRLQPA